ncbi:MAG: 2-keto-4-pentenoate hydratase, partial [Beijerinckiaceae bacterium]
MATDPAYAAAQVFQCLRNTQQIAPFTAADPGFSAGSAYAVTADLRRLRIAAGEKPAGRKIGFTNRTIWDEYGVFAPIWGDVYDTTVHATDSSARGSLSLAGLLEPRIEPEIIFGLKGPVSPDMDDASLIGALDWIAHGFEIVQSIYPDWRFAIADTIACGGLHGRMIVGPKRSVAHWTTGNLARALAAFQIELACGGESIDSGGGANVLDSPLN